MGNIKIIRGVFDTKLELQHAGVKAGFPSPAEDYIHETLDFRSNLFACLSKNRDYIRHPEASFYGDIEGDSMRSSYARLLPKGRKNAIKHDFKSKNPTTRWADVIKLH